MFDCSRRSSYFRTSVTMKIPKKLFKDPAKYANTLNRKQLDSLLDYLDDMYYVKDEPALEDVYYDAIYDVYAERYPKSARLKATGKSSKQEDILLPIPLPSLDKIKPGTKASKTFLTTDKDVRRVVSDKLDGIAIELIYKDGKPVNAYKRGSGTEGKDITHHIPNMKIPKKLKVKGTLIVRAEAVISVAKFEKLYGDEYNNPRNFVAGVLNSLTPKSAVKKLDIVTFEVLEGKYASKTLERQLSFLKDNQFDVVFFMWESSGTLTDEFLTKVHEARMQVSPYLLDGLVVSKCITYERGSAKPKHAKAFKINSIHDMVEVPILRIDWEETRTGYFAPVARYAPIKLDSITNDVATAHNAYFVMHGHTKSDAAAAKKKGKKLKSRPLGPGAVVRIMRSGKVIPTIESVIRAAKKPQMPEGDWELRGVHAYNKEETELVKIKELTHFFKCVGIEGMQQSTVQKLYDAGYTTIPAIRDITLSDYEAIPGFGRSKGMVHIKQMASKAHKSTYVQLANASNLFLGFSEGRLSKIIEEIPNPNKYWKANGSADLKDAIQNIEGFKEIASVFVKAVPKFRKFLKANGLKIVKPKKAKKIDDSLEDLIITFTGVRDDKVKSHVESRGGKIQSMRKDTNLLIVPNSDYTSSKVDKANESDLVTVMILEDFKAKYNL